MVKLTVGLPTTATINIKTVISIIQALKALKLDTELKFSSQEGTDEQVKSQMVTSWYDSSGDNDMLLLVNDNISFTVDDVVTLIKTDSVVAVCIYNEEGFIPESQMFFSGQDDKLLYVKSGLMLIRKHILKEVEQIIQGESGGISRFGPAIPFFRSRLIATGDGTDWLDGDYGFCWLVRRAGGSIRGILSRTVESYDILPTTYYPKEFKRTFWPNNSIVYYSGQSNHSNRRWSPMDLSKSIHSEDLALYHLSKAWSTLGKDVTIYGNCEQYVYGNVKYFNYTSFSTHDYYKTVVVRYGPSLDIINKVEGKQICVDVYGVPNKGFNDVLEQNIYRVDKIFVRSYFQLTMLPPIIQKKAVIIPGGVPEEYKSGYSTTKLNKVIYTSDYNRGLYQILMWGWPKIRKAAPEAEFHVYHGPDGVDEDTLRSFKPLFDQKGVFVHNYVDNHTLYQARAEAKVHLYLGGLNEVDCLSVKESACLDCVPIVSDTNVFKERNYCMKLDGNQQNQKTYEYGGRIAFKLLKQDDFYGAAKNKVDEGKSAILTWRNTAQLWLQHLL